MVATSTLYPDILPKAASGLCVGMLSHLCILKMKVEVEHLIWHLLGSYVAVLSALIYVHVSLTNWSPFEAIGYTLLETASFNMGLIISIMVYRLYFHPLRRFPGPLLAKVSMLYVVWTVHKSGVRYHEVLNGWHRLYGDVVRVGRHSSNFPASLKLVLSQLSVRPTSSQHLTTICRRYHSGEVS